MAYPNLTQSQVRKISKMLKHRGASLPKPGWLVKFTPTERDFVRLGVLTVMTGNWSPSEIVNDGHGYFLL